ncbi:MAG: ribonuclease III [Flavobacteriaceae bacterium]|nr:ribonuclease III [Flavobacteriaceae bacterium]|tara:strand:+ start:10615 stop:11349 length:735 start_codon:yes stop_codon:yes gene_type:complete
MFLGQFFNKNKNSEYIFYSKLKKLLGFSINKFEPYKKAFTHKSMNLKDINGEIINYERLEFLGDSLLGSCVSSYLFEKFPKSNEGDLTKLRSKIVNRETLNKIGFDLQLYKFTNSNYKIEGPKDDVNGNLLEALIGAVYLDKGYKKCENFVLSKIISSYVDFKSLNDSIISYKGALIEWGQKNKHKIVFHTQEDAGLDSEINFSSILLFNKKVIAKAREISKKKAEEKVAKRAYNNLKLNSLNN